MSALPTPASIRVAALSDTLFTIGHSTHTLEHFAGSLLKHGITALCDVRSTPYSRSNPQFNREELRKSLRPHAIEYVFLGTELGARSSDPSCYEDGKVQYGRLVQTELFQKGLERVQNGTKEYRVALMCAEKEPLDCHRTILVARHLVERGLSVQHIHANGTLESHAAALSRLAQILHLREPVLDMFRSHEELLADIYRLQEQRIAYTSKSSVSPGTSKLKSATL